MRQFVIRSFETIVWVVGVLFALVGVIGGLIALSQGHVQGLALVIIGPLYAILLMGVFFIAIAVSDNTRRTAEAIEKLVARG